MCAMFHIAFSKYKSIFITYWLTLVDKKVMTKKNFDEQKTEIL